MPKRLGGILLCLLLANVLNYALGEWLDQQIPNWAPPEAMADGSTFNTSRYYQNRSDTLLAGRPDEEALLDFYAYLDQGGSATYLDWQASRKELRGVATPFLQRAITVADANNTGKYLSLLLLIFTGLLLFGRAFKESSWLTPVLHFGIVLGTAALYGSLSAPLFMGLVAGSWLLYFGSLRAFLPIYHTEWSRLMRPGLSLCLFLLAAMAWRGPEVIDYWFWTSPLFRLGLVTVLLFTVFFHFSILVQILKAAEMDQLARIFAYGMPFGLTLLVLGFVLGLFGQEAGDAMRQLNYELLTLPPETVAKFDPDAPFLLSLVGVVLLILAGIGYYIQRIAK